MFKLQARIHPPILASFYITDKRYIPNINLTKFEPHERFRSGDIKGEGNYLKGRNFLRKKFLRKKFLRFITSKMLYSAEEIFAVEGFLINFAELFFAIQENEPVFAELTFAIERF